MISKSHFSYFYGCNKCTKTGKQSLNHLLNLRENVTTVNCQLQNFFISLKVRCVLSNVGGSEESQLWVVLGGSEKKTAAGAGSECAMSQQVFRVITFCINTRFQSFSTLLNGKVHHHVLKFSPCRNKLLPQASTCWFRYMRSCCNVPQSLY